MSTWLCTVTNKGAQLIGKTISGEAYQISKAVSGAGHVPPTDLKEQIHISDPKQILSLQSITAREDGAVLISVLLSNDGLKNGYDLLQVGIYAVDPDEGEILFAIAQADQGEHIESFAGAPGFCIEWNFAFKNSASNEVTLTVNPAGIATKEDLSRKVDKKAGDISETVIKTLDHITADYPEPAAGEPVKTFLGKVRKCVADLVGSKGAPGGLATLGSNGKVETEQLPVIPTMNDLEQKLDKSGGDISETKILTADSIAEEFPVPSAGDSPKLFLGKMRKFAEDFRNLKTGLLTVGMLVNNCATDNSGLPLSAAQGKVLMDAITRLNSELKNRVEVKFFAPDIPYSVALTSFQDIVNIIGRNGWIYSESGNTINPKPGIMFIIHLTSFRLMQVAVAYGHDASMYVSVLVDKTWTRWKENNNLAEKNLNLFPIHPRFFNLSTLG